MEPPLNVLVVDDDPVMVAYLEAALKNMGYVVAGIAQNGKDAVEMARERAPQLILMDIRLPEGMNGIAATKKIHDFLDVPVIFITAHEKEAFLEGTTALNPGGFLFKPIDDRQLKISIELALKKYALEQENKKYHGLLEEKVRARTAQLEVANRKLEARILECNAAEEKLKSSSKELSELNAALKTLLRLRDQDRRELERRVLLNMRHGIYPHLERLKTAPLPKGLSAHVNAIESNLQTILSPFIHEVLRRFTALSPTEAQVVNHIRNGKSSKDIARVMGLAKPTVDSHRNSIRKKLGLKNKNEQLKYFLQTIEPIPPPSYHIK